MSRCGRCIDWVDINVFGFIMFISLSIFEACYAAVYHDLKDKCAGGWGPIVALSVIHGSIGLLFGFNKYVKTIDISTGGLSEENQLLCIKYFFVRLITLGTGIVYIACTMYYFDVMFENWCEDHNKTSGGPVGGPSDNPLLTIVGSHALVVPLLFLIGGGVCVVVVLANCLEIVGKIFKCFVTLTRGFIKLFRRTGHNMIPDKDEEIATLNHETDGCRSDDSLEIETVNMNRKLLPGNLDSESMV